MCDNWVLPSQQCHTGNPLVGPHVLYKLDELYDRGSITGHWALTEEDSVKHDSVTWSRRALHWVRSVRGRSTPHCRVCTGDARHVSVRCCVERAQCKGLSYQRLFNAKEGVPAYSPGRLTVVAALDGQPSSACVAARSPQLACCRGPPRGTSGSGTPQQSWWAAGAGSNHAWHQACIIHACTGGTRRREPITSRGCMAPKPRARRWPLTGGRLPREPAAAHVAALTRLHHSCTSMQMTPQCTPALQLTHRPAA